MEIESQMTYMHGGIRACTTIHDESEVKEKEGG